MALWIFGLAFLAGFLTGFGNVTGSLLWAWEG